ncbi:MAG: DNA topoisomerase IV [Candidatus Cloacimonetes bacterium 4572_55]|nr:MAG: DNA topoisomerase IV [Candidatus Cloacimonetes bacterium 4572_55]
MSENLSTIKNQTDHVLENGQSGQSVRAIQHVSGMYRDWFLEYASYVILERAVPALEDGLKPVQRRILHSMNEMHDGRFHKVANIIGQTMQYHPHGDTSIGDALVNLGQKELLIDTQGNWGDSRTGDPAAASRYIEARLSKFALEVAFHPVITEYQLSYDGRKKEPILLPVKFPLLLAQGAEGIAVGLATRIMPHNFNELIQASIDMLRGKQAKLLPDFPSRGAADFSAYNDGKKGGKIRVRARIEAPNKRTLLIKEIPFGTTTTGVINSIVKATDNNKIKIKRVVDNTAKEIEILIELPPGVSPNITIDALYAFTSCEVSISPNNCLIIEDKPRFLGTNEILKRSTEHTLYLLRRELEAKQAELSEKQHFASLEKIFIEKKIYRRIEKCETWQSVLETIEGGLDRYKKRFVRAIKRENLVRLTEIRIKRISKYNSFQADEEIKKLEKELSQVDHYLNHLTDYAVDYFQEIKKKYGKDEKRRTKIQSFDAIEATQVAVANEKLYVDRQEGFIGYGLKKAEFVRYCSDIDDVIVFFENGSFLVTRISEKSFVGKNIIHVNVWSRSDERLVYNFAYMDGKTKVSYVKRFHVTAITRDRLYDLTMGTKNSKVVYFTANPNSEGEVIAVHLRSSCNARTKRFDFDFSQLAVKGRDAKGNILTKYSVRKITQQLAGLSTIGGRDIWFDRASGRLNKDGRGTCLGSFDTGDLIMIIYKKGGFELTDYKLTNHYKREDILIIEKFDPQTVVSAVYYDGESGRYYVKRFQIEKRATGKRFTFISESSESHLFFATTTPSSIIDVTVEKGKARQRLQERINLQEFINVKGWRAMGNRISRHKVINVTVVSPLPEQNRQEQNRTDGEGQAELFV